MICLRICHQHVLRDGAIEEIVVFRSVTDRVAPFPGIELPNVQIVGEHGAHLRAVQAQNGAHDGRLAGAAGAGDGKHFALGHPEGQIAQGGFLASGVAHDDLREGDISLQRPVQAGHAAGLALQLDLQKTVDPFHRLLGLAKLGQAQKRLVHGVQRPPRQRHHGDEGALCEASVHDLYGAKPEDTYAAHGHHRLGCDLHDHGKLAGLEVLEGKVGGDGPVFLQPDGIG